MINRSIVKYYLKKILPTPLFKIVHVFWSKVLLSVVDGIDAIRLKKFTSERLVTLTHKNKNFSLVISPNNGFIDRHIFLYGVYEPFMLDLINAHVKSGMTFVDIGANIGQHSMYAASIVGESGAVYSYEPIPFIYEQLQKSVEANHFQNIVHANNIALGDKESVEKFNISKNVGGSSLVNDDETSETINVIVKDGGNELSSLASIDMIKIDVEGYEYEVLHGIKKSLLTHKPILLLEFSGEFYVQQNNQHGGKIIELLRACNYSLFDIEDSMKEINDDASFVSLFKNKKRVQTNLLCIVQQKP